MGSIPVGYITERNEEDPRYGKFIIYKPHAKIVHWLFVRFVKLGYDLVEFKRELQAMPYIFPAFESWVHPSDTSKCNLRVQNGGFSFCESTIEKILTNQVYIGIFKREGVTRVDNHPAIIEEDLFWSVYDRLRDFRPDGTPTNRVRRVVKYSQITYAERKPLFTFTSSDPKATVSYGRSAQWYHYKVRVYDGMSRETVVSAYADVVEDAIVAQLFERLQLQDIDIGDMEKKRAAIIEKNAKRKRRLEQSIEAIDEEIDTLTVNMGKIKTDVVVARLETQIEKLLGRKSEAEAELVQIAQSSQEIVLGTFEEELKDLEQSWHKHSFGLRKSLLKLLIKELKLDYVSPRFYRITIVWMYGNWGVETAFIDKGKGNKKWRSDDNKILRDMYRDKSQLEIMKALPQRSWRSILHQADHLGVREGTWKPKTIKNVNICLDDMAFLEKFGLTLEQFQDGNDVVWYFW
ncbi:recombinase family protein [Dictyobacter aurantiacus]